MKKIIFLLAALLPVLFAGAQEISKTIPSTVSDVTVYMNGALITHTANVNLTKGKYNLIFTGISPNINQKSIQVTGNNDIKITSVTYMIDYLDSKTESYRIQNLKDSLTLLTRKSKTIEDQISAFSNEKDLILKNNDLGGTTTGVQVLELQKAADFYRLRINDINTQVQKLTEEKELITTQHSKVHKQLLELNSKQNQPVYKLSVTADVTNPTTCNMFIKYLVTGTGWAAYYDIRAIDVSNPIQLDYKAKVYNNCGLDWKDVKLTLSTADPNQSAQRPTLTPWTLNYNSDDYTFSSNRDLNEGYLNTRAVDEEKDVSADTVRIDKGGKKSQWRRRTAADLCVRRGR